MIFEGILLLGWCLNLSDKSDIFSYLIPVPFNTVFIVRAANATNTQLLVAAFYSFGSICIKTCPNSNISLLNVSFNLCAKS